MITKFAEAQMISKTLEARLISIVVAPLISNAAG